MYKVFERDGKIIKAWVDGVEFADNAKDQLFDLASMPFIFRHVAAMPDVHYGKGSTIGSVFSTQGAVIPSAVGVDIGCGMAATKTLIHSRDLPDDLGELYDLAKELTPIHLRQIEPEGLGYSVSDVLSNVLDCKRPNDYEFRSYFKANTDRVIRQAGTLGGGNHFLELCLDEDGWLWVVLHSGSRGLGAHIGRHYISKAKQIAKDYFIELPHYDLAYLPKSCKEYDMYLMDLRVAQWYAKYNRRVMMNCVTNGLSEFFVEPLDELIDLEFDCAHNFAAMEYHYGKNVLVTRKGATRARRGDIGIIPSAMGGVTYIVEGKGNPDSYHSCSHGAGRVMSRGKAFKEITEDEHLEAMQGVFCRKDRGVLDESPRAYKDIEAVIAAQRDLVEVKHKLKAFVNIKG